MEYFTIPSRYQYLKCAFFNIKLLHNICINDDDIYLGDSVDIANDNNHEAHANVMRNCLSYFKNRMYSIK